MTNEQQLTEDVEAFFNEEDTSVGMYAVGKMDKMVVSQFKEVFEGVHVVQFSEEQMEFEIDGTAYRVHLSEKHECWKLHRLIRP